MCSNRFILFQLFVLALVAARPASAQVGEPWIDRGYLNLGVTFETTSGVLTDARAFTIYDENATVASSSTVDSGALIDFAIGSRVWRNASVGLGYTRGSTSGEGAVTGAIPHPLVFGAPRSLAVTVADLDRTEQSLLLQLGYMLVLSDRIDVHLTVGPSLFRLTQDVVEGIDIGEAGGAFTTVSGTPRLTDRSDSAIGFNVGADATYRFYDSPDWRLGAGLVIRYNGASAKIRLLENTVDSDVGGLQIGFGLRARF